MTAQTCAVCGTDYDPSRGSCPLCGEPVPEEDGTDSGGGNGGNGGGPVGSRLERGRGAATPAAAEAVGSDYLYRLTVGLLIAYAVLGVGSLLLRNTGTFYLAVGLLFASIVTMYLDLRSLEERLYRVRPILWVVGAVLLPFVVLPLYAYKRFRVG